MGCWETVHASERVQVPRSKWVLQHHRDHTCQVKEYEAWFVLFSNEKQDNKKECFLRVANFTISNLILAALFRVGIHHVNTILEKLFRNERMNRRVYLYSPKFSLNTHNVLNNVIKLRRPFYRRKDAAKSCRETASKCFCSIGLDKLVSAPFVFMTSGIIIISYASDRVSSAKDKRVVGQWQSSLGRHLLMRNLGKPSGF